jgi:acyl transferase domain-containing protein/phosphopantetheinyl transferase (holo-ACP synthase)
MDPLRQSGQGIAVVGMSALFPGAPDLDSFWRNLVDGHDSITDAPADRWDPVYYDPAGTGPDRFYCRRGGFLGELATFDPQPFGIMPNAVDGVEPDQLLALRVARAALDDAGGDRAAPVAERTGVVVGRGGYLTPGVARLEQRVRTAQQLVESVRSLVPEVDEQRLADVKDAFVAQLGPDRPESAIDLVPNLVASRIANRLDLHGPAYTVDGACASSLLAVDAGMRELRSGRCDLVLAGGVHLCHDVTLWSVFTQLRALSPSQQMRPFDRRADGLLIGEGAGMVALKRLEDAERDGDRIYAVLCGSGISSDGREVSLMKPSPTGQMLALERAWLESGLDPASCGLIEAHGTATPTGDGAELETLTRFFGPNPKPGARGRIGGRDEAWRADDYPDGGRAVVGSVKSMIGHAMPAAGAAGLIKAVLAVHHGIAPPTLHCDEPDPRLEGTRFRPSSTAVDWDVDPAVRVAGVNAFGFGGINTHVVLRAHADAVGPRSPRKTSRGTGRTHPAGRRFPQPPQGGRDPQPAQPSGGRVILLAARDVDGLRPQLDATDLLERDDRLCPPPPEAGPFRLALVDPKPARLDLARRVVTGGKPWRGRNDVWFSPGGLLDKGGKLAFVFPGVEPNQDSDASAVAEHFGWTPPTDLGETELERQSRSILWTGRILDAALRRLGVAPDAMAGHSLGEWSGLIATGMVPRAIVDELSNGLLPTRLSVPDVAYLMVGADVAKAQAAITDLPAMAVSHDNCHHQSVLCGDEAGCAEAARRLRDAGVICQELPIRSGFHSPAFAPFLGPFRETYDRIEFEASEVPLWSATAVAPYPDEAESVRQLSLRHLVEPVRFRQLAEAMYEDGFRVFVQMGFGSVGAFLEDTLHDRELCTLSAGSAKHPGMAQVLRLAAGLWSEGAPVRFEELAARGGGGADGRLGRTEPFTAAAPPIGRPLRLGVPLVRVDPGAVSLGLSPSPQASPSGTLGLSPVGQPGLSPVGLGRGLTAPIIDSPSIPAIPESHPILVAYQQVMAETVAAGQQAIEAWSQSGPSTFTAPRESPMLSTDEPVLTTDEPVFPTDEPMLPTEESSPPAESPANGDQELLSRVTTWTVSVETHPELLDHCFYRQPEGWPSVQDLFPVVPMTMLLEIMGRAAQELVPGTVVTGFDDVRALRWLAAAPPVETTIRSKLMLVPADQAASGAQHLWRVQVSIDGYAKTTVVLGHDYPIAPDPDPTPLIGERESDIAARTMYDDRWMFHGPAYQGVTELTAVAEDGIRGRLADLAAPGALLDCAGQLMGYWAMRRTEIDRLALPTSIRRVRFFGSRPGPTAPVSCTVRITQYTERLVQSDMDLCVDGDLWARIDSWQDRRFESDPVVWPVLIYPETNVLTDQRVMSRGRPSADGASIAGASAHSASPSDAAVDPSDAAVGVGVEVAHERWTDSASRGLMMRRYLGEDERADYERHNPRAQRTWLLGRIAAKDAVRRYLWDRGARPMHPVEVHISNDDHGRPVASVPPDVSAAHPAASALAVSISHTEWIGVAVVSDAGPIGVDVEPATPRAPRSNGFVDIALTPHEQDLRPDGVGPDAWVALAWTAKEAVAKAIGTGLQGRPRTFEVEELTDPDSQSELTLWVRDPEGRRWTVASSREGESVIAVTVGQPDATSVQDPGPFDDESPAYQQEQVTGIPTGRKGRT